MLSVKEVGMEAVTAAAALKVLGKVFGMGFAASKACKTLGSTLTSSPPSKRS